MAKPYGILFDEPLNKPISTTGATMPGAYYLFYYSNTLVPAPVYADGLLSTVLSQTPGQAQPSCTADANGRFNAIYMDPANTYRVQLYNVANQLQENVDPYVVPASVAALAGQSGSGTLTLTDTVNTATLNYSYVLSNGGTVVTLSVQAGTIASSTNTCVINGLPSNIVPQTGTCLSALAWVSNGGSNTGGGGALISAGSSTIRLFPGNNINYAGWTIGGYKGPGGGFTMTYPLNGVIQS